MKKIKCIFPVFLAFLQVGLTSCQNNIPISVPSFEVIENEGEITLKGETTSLKVGEQTRLEVQVQAKNIEVEFSSSDESVASVDNTGLVSGLKQGEVTIKAQLKNTDKFAEVKLNVYEVNKTTFEVRYVNFDGSLLYSKFVKKGESVTFEGQNPKRSADYQYAYIFTGWDKQATNVSEDLTITALYQQVEIQDYIFTPINASEGGYMLYYYFGDEEEIVIPELYNNKPVVKIDVGAFVFAKNLKKVTIPNTVNELADKAFYGNSTIEEIVVPNSVFEIGEQAFASCPKLKKVVLPNGLVKIPSGSFSGCTLLVDVNIPSTVKEIGDDAFSGCKALTNIVLSNEVKIIGDSAFKECTSLVSFKCPTNLTLLGQNAFRGCTSLESFEFNALLTEVPYGCFWDDVKLTNIVIPNGITSIGTYAFDNTGLVELSLPDSVNSVGRSAFSECEKLTKVKWSLGMTEVSTSAFDGCVLLKTITGLDNVTSFADGAFRDSGFEIVDNTLIGEKVTTLGKNTFYGCAKLKTVNIPSNVKKIDSGCFRNCDVLTTVTIQEGLTDLLDNAFTDCNALKTVSLPSTLVNYGSSYTHLVFSEDNMLESITVNSDKFVSIDGVVYSKDKTSIYEYPAGKKATTYALDDLTTIIDTKAFYKASNLTSVDLKNVTTIKNEAFSYTSLKNLTIPKTITSLAYGSFSYISSLESITFDKDSPITSLSSSFTDNAKLKTVVLPNNVKTLSSTFRNCSLLESINLPTTLTSISANTFTSRGLVATYNGTKKQFLGQVKTYSTSFASGEKVVCTDGEITY